MNEDQKKWLLNLQEKGIKFENVSLNGMVWNIGVWEFKNDPKDYRIPAQSIPDVPNWRELCLEMQSNGVEFETICKDESWKKSRPCFSDYMRKKHYRIPQQPIPEWREEMTEETKQDPREEIPHREQQIQWHEDMLHHLRTGEPMRMWEWKKKSDGTWGQTIEPGWDAKTEYRRKPRTVTYWHCVVLFDGSPEIITGYGVNEMKYQVDRCKKTYPLAKIGPITETTVELED